MRTGYIDRWDSMTLKSIRDFLKQDYSNKELVIVDSADNNYGKQKLVENDWDQHPDIVYIPYHDTVFGQSAEPSQIEPIRGWQRKLGVMAASGEFIVNWDDDDFNMPDRLSQSREAIEGLECAAIQDLLIYHDGEIYLEPQNNGRSYQVEMTFIYRRDTFMQKLELPGWFNMQGLLKGVHLGTINDPSICVVRFHDQTLSTKNHWLKRLANIGPLCGPYREMIDEKMRRYHGI